MPELPEVESTRRALARDIVDRRIASVVVRDRRLRWPVPMELSHRLTGQEIRDVRRRAKYLLVGVGTGTILIHLGMSGSLRLVDAHTPPQPHDHIDLVFDDGRCVRYRDPRRFGCMLWIGADPAQHRLLARLGPEPLEPEFNGPWLHAQLRRRTAPIKSLLMDARIVVGVGNIYANEALFIAGIDPRREGGRIAVRRVEGLVHVIKQVLDSAIEFGGTTLRDYVHPDGVSGTFVDRCKVYGREGMPCSRCAAPISKRFIAQRATYFCQKCQR